jgi:Rad3-related DNA helicase
MRLPGAFEENKSRENYCCLYYINKDREHKGNLARKSILEGSTNSKTVTPTVFEA